MPTRPFGRSLAKSIAAVSKWNEPPMPVRPFGRSLADFGTLREAERKLLENCRRGVECVIGMVRPGADGKTADNAMRAGFLRFLILGGDDKNPVHEYGVRVQGAWIEDVLDLDGVASTSDVWMTSCWFDDTPVLSDAHIKGNLVLSDSKVPGLSGDRLTCDASLFCLDNFLSDHEFRLLGAEIGGDLACKGATFNGPVKDGKLEGNALNADRINVKGSVFFIDNFNANGEVRLLGAAIGGELLCRGAIFNGPLDDGKLSGKAISADRIVVKGNVFLGGKLIANGEVRLLGATIGGNLECTGATFSPGSEYSINASGISVAGTFLLRGLESPAGEINLSDARVRVLVDDEVSWSQNLNLDGFTYDRIGGDSPKDAKTRLKWLDKQRPKWSGKDGRPDQFRPQPWLHLRKVLREAGHAEDARLVGIAFEERRRKCGQIKPQAWIFHWLYGVFTGYGYRPMRLLVSSLLVWLLCGLIYDFAASDNVFAPTDSLSNYERGCTGPAIAQAKCTAPELSVFHPPFDGNYTTFHPFAYSLNVFLPVVNLGQEAAWAPSEKPFSPDYLGTLFNLFTDFAGRVQLLIWVETLLGWFAGLLLVAVVSGLARKQDDS